MYYSTSFHGPKDRGRVVAVTSQQGMLLLLTCGSYEVCIGETCNITVLYGTKKTF
jgi:hypothetical protein